MAMTSTTKHTEVEMSRAICVMFSLYNPILTSPVQTQLQIKLDCSFPIHNQYTAVPYVTPLDKKCPTQPDDCHPFLI